MRAFFDGVRTMIGPVFILLAAWLLGGLNFQVEHHLFPRVCHVNYPAITKIVEETCDEFGVKYRAHKSFWTGIASHFRWLRQMGMAPQTG